MKRYAAGLAVLALLFGACDSQAPLTSDDAPTVSKRPKTLAESPSTLAVPQAEPQIFRVCKQYVGTVGPAVTIDFTVDEFSDGSIDVTDAVTLADGECADIWTDNTLPDIPNAVTVAEQVPAGYAASFEKTEVTFTVTSGYHYTTVTGTGNATSGVVQSYEPQIGTLVVFTNTEIPEIGEEGCTPGYWKNHLGAWAGTGYAPGDDFDTTFGVDLFDPDITLNDAVRAKGGHENRLARHGTAALLSAAHTGVAYPYTVAEVIALVQAGDADALEQANELGCPL